MKELPFKLSVDLEEGLKECREGSHRFQNLPESGSVSTSDHWEHLKAAQQTLDEYRAQLGAHEKKLQDGERHMRRLQEEVTAHRIQPKPEVHEGFESVGCSSRNGDSVRSARGGASKISDPAFTMAKRQRERCSSN